MIKLVDFDKKFTAAANKWHNDPQIAKAIGITKDNPININDWFNDPSMYPLGILLNDKPVGYVLIKVVDVEKGIGELHITIGEDEGRGIAAYNAYKKMIIYAFDILKLEILCTYCFEDRKDIRNMMDKGVFGFKYIGNVPAKFQLEDKIIDYGGNIYIYNLKKENFKPIYKK